MIKIQHHHVYVIYVIQSFTDRYGQTDRKLLKQDHRTNPTPWVGWGGVWWGGGGNCDEEEAQEQEEEQYSQHYMY